MSKSHRRMERDSTTRHRTLELEKPAIDAVQKPLPAPPGRVGYSGSPIGPEHPRTTPRGTGTESPLHDRRR